MSLTTICKRDLEQVVAAVVQLEPEDVLPLGVVGGHRGLGVGEVQAGLPAPRGLGRGAVLRGVLVEHHPPALHQLGQSEAATVSRDRAPPTTAHLQHHAQPVPGAVGRPPRGARPLVLPGSQSEVSTGVT